MALLGGAPDAVSAEEIAALSQCLEDETLLRLFLTGVIGQTGPLSAESSTCVRSGFANFDLRSVMFATPAESEEEAAMVGGMVGFLLTLSCLNEEEWQAVGPSLGMGADDRDSLQCVIAELGSQEGLAAALQSGAVPPTAFFGASTACDPQMTEGESGTITTTPVPDDSLIWQYETGALDEFVIVSPTVVEGVVYAGSDEDRVYALDAETGKLLWSFEVESDLSIPPLVSGGVVFAEDIASIYALDAATGTELWRSELFYSSELSSSSVSGATAYQGTETADGLEVSAIDGRTGNQTWATNVPRSSPIPLLFPLTAAGANVYVSDEFQVRALDSTTGKLVWSFDTGDVVQSPPTASNGAVFLRSYTTAYALDESTGEQLWSYEVDSVETDSPPVVMDGVWYLNDSALRTLDAATGQLLWSFAVDEEKAGLGEAATRPLAVAEGMVFVQTLFTYEPGRNALHALDTATGDEVWSLGADWDLSSIMVVDGVLYAHSLSGYLHTLDALTGEPIWSVHVGYHWWQRPFAVSDDVVYVGYLPTTWTEGQGSPSSGVYAFTAPRDMFDDARY